MDHGPQPFHDKELVQDVNDIVDRFKVAYKGRQSVGLNVLANALGQMIALTSYHDKTPCTFCSHRALGNMMSVTATACGYKQAQLIDKLVNDEGDT